MSFAAHSQPPETDDIEDDIQTEDIEQPDDAHQHRVGDEYTFSNSKCAWKWRVEAVDGSLITLSQTIWGIEGWTAKKRMTVAAKHVHTLLTGELQTAIFNDAAQNPVQGILPGFDIPRHHHHH
jgi:hypothetical protein